MPMNNDFNFDQNCLKNVILQRTTADHLVLPPKQEYVMLVGLTSLQEKLYKDKLCNQLNVHARDGSDKKCKAQLDCTLLKIAVHSDLVDGVKSKYDGMKTKKIEVIKSIVQAAKEAKIVIFTSHREMVPILQESLQAFHVWTLRAQRDEVTLNRFKNINGPAILISTHTICGTGIDLTAASVVINVEPM